MRQHMPWRMAAAGAALILSACLPGMPERMARASSAAAASLVHYTLCAPSNRAVSALQMQMDRRLIQNRLTGGFGVAHSQVTRSGKRCLRVTLPAMKGQKAIAAGAGQTGYIALADSGTRALNVGSRVQLVCKRSGCAPGIPVGTTNLDATPPRLRIVVAMQYMERGSAYLRTDQAGSPAIIYSLAGKGARIWCTFTTRHVQQFAAIVLDNRILSDPLIQSGICGGQTEIVGIPTRLAARKIMAFLNTEPLPVPLHITAAH